MLLMDTERELLRYTKGFEVATATDLTKEEAHLLSFIRRFAETPGALRSVRQNARLSMRQTASASGIGLATLSRLESQKQVPGPGVLGYAVFVRELMDTSR
jgi:hypothetical protein